MAVDPNEGASPERVEQLRQANIEGAKFKATMEGLNSVFKDLKSSSADALKTDVQLLGQLSNISKGFGKAVGLAQKLKGFTLEDLKNAKKQNAFQSALSEAKGDQARIAADIAVLEEQRIIKQNQQKAIQADMSAEVEKQIALIGEERSILNALESDRARFLQEAEDLEKQINENKKKGSTEAINQIAKLQEQLKYAQQEYILTDDKVKKLTEEADEIEKVIEAHRELSDQLDKQVDTIEAVSKQAEKYKKEIDATVSAASDLSTEILKVQNAAPKFIQAFEKFGELASAIPIVGPLINSITKDISKSAEMFRKAKAEGKSTFEAWGKAGLGFLKLGLFAAAAKFVQLVVDGAMKSSNAIVELNKSVAGSTLNMSAQMGRISGAASRFGLPIQEAVKIIGGLNETLGVSLDYTQETTTQAIKLAGAYGVSGQAVGNLVKLSGVQNVTMTKMVDSITGGVAQFNALNGVSISTKAVMEDIGSASAATLRNVGNSPAAITKAAAAARSLGMSMDQVNDAARSTLDFEQSLQDEMEAELMLGKELNLDKLRAAAATGDTVTQAAELKRLVMENAGAIGNNVLAQENFAKSIGISREQYNEMLNTNDALSVLTGKSGAAEEANAKARKMSQEDIAKSIDATTGKLVTLQDRIEKFQENMALGAYSFADDLISKIKEGDWAGAGKMIWEELITKPFEEGWDYFKNGSNVGRFLGATVIGGGAAYITFKAGQTLLSAFKSLTGMGSKTGILSKDTYTPDGRLRVDAGGGMGNSTDMGNSIGSSLANSLFRGNVFKYLGPNGGLGRTLQRTMIKTFGKGTVGKTLYKGIGSLSNSKILQTIGKPISNVLSRVIPNSMTNLTKKFGTNNMAKITKMANTGTDAAGKVISKKVQQQALKTSTKFIKPQFATEAANLGKTSLKVGTQAAQTATQTAANVSKMAKYGTKLAKIFSKANIGAIVGGLAVDYVAGKAEQTKNESYDKAMNLQTNNVVGLNANMTDLTDKMDLLAKANTAGNVSKAAGVGSAALTGAGIGAMVGSIVPGIGNAIGGAVGGVIGAGVGLYQQYFSKEAKENAKIEKEARAQMLGITLDQEKLLRAKGVDEAVKIRLAEAEQAKLATQEMLQMDLASFAQMTAEEQNRHINKLNLSEQMMEELNSNIGVATQDLGKIIEEEAKKIEDNSFIGKTKKFFSGLFGGGDEKNVTKIEQTIDSAPIIKASSADANKIKNSVASSEKTIGEKVLAADKAAKADALRSRSKQEEINKANNLRWEKQMRLQAAMLTKEQKIILDGNKVGKSLIQDFS
jgi:hypothetical protein